MGDENEFFKNFNKSEKNIYGIIANGFNFNRKKIVKEVKKKNPNFKWATLIHPSCNISKSSKILDGTVVMASTTINNHTKIGKHCLINTSSSIDHDNYFDDYSSCGPGVITGGNVKIGNSSYIGIGTTVKHGVTIGKDTLVGGHSFVNKNCKDNFIYYGVPIKEIKKRKSSSNYF